MNFNFFINIWSLLFLFTFLASKLEAQRYVTWDDIKMDFDNFDLNDEILRKSQGIIVVDWSGNGDSVTIQGAIDKVPDFNSQRIKIFIRSGIYREKVFIPSSKPFISLIGDENHPGRTLITWNSKACDKDQFGYEIGTVATATVAVESDYFCATGITIENTVVALPQDYNMQGVALRLAGDKAMLYRLRILGSQDSLYDEIGSHFFFKCYIQGTVDFICGNATSLFQGCDLHSIALDNVGISGAIAAHQRDSPYENSGFSFVNCKVTGSGSVLLGRAWGEYSRIIYSKCYFDGLITPQGWYDWDLSSRQEHVLFGEYKCKGSGANRTGRVPWSKYFSKDQVQPYLKRNFIGGEQWLRI